MPPESAHATCASYSRVTMARNSILVAICQNVRTSDRGARVIEALATGIPTVLRSLEAAGLPPPMFQDQSIRFTVILRNAATRKTIRTPLTTSERRVYEVLLAGPASVLGLEEQLGMKAYTVRRILRSLREKKIVTQHGGPGQPTTHEVADVFR
ncbi:ATP-binding protein [Phytoactinopolyspora endophytica]|uniref:ATP-binding protein n=1 Tax=Phytoactinopolyspora endophytica TaxID=1642495 RepID=UPI0023EA6326|nr:ATP-binding protein [Phytoactinopolyspora endophytica]